MNEIKWYDLMYDSFTNGCSVYNTETYFLMHAHKNKKEYFQYETKSGAESYFSFKKNTSIDKIKEEICEIEKFYTIFSKQDTCHTLISDNSGIVIGYVGKKIRIVCNSFDKNVVDKIEKIAKKYLNFDIKQNQFVYMLSPSNSGLELINIGSFENKINKKNYNQSVLKEFNTCINGIVKKKTFGRLSVIYGPPGTGKTYLLRSVINQIKDAVFIYTPPDNFKQFSTVNFVTALSGFKKQKIILLVEDADSILIDRGKNSEDLVSNILNFTDGFIGEALDLHLICTTNIDKLDIDQAYKRKGRLNKFLNVGLLSPEEAQMAYDSLKIKNKPQHTFTEPTSLADIYASAESEKEQEEKDKKPENKNQKRKIGFAMPVANCA